MGVRYVCAVLGLGVSLQACGREVCGQVCAVQKGFGGVWDICECTGRLLSPGVCVCVQH